MEGQKPIEPSQQANPFLQQQSYRLPKSRAVAAKFFLLIRYLMLRDSCPGFSLSIFPDKCQERTSTKIVLGLCGQIASVNLLS
jgi:hypothetical protein